MSADRCWIAVVPEAEADEAAAHATLTDLAGAPAGVLAAWLRRSKPRRDALRADPRAIDASGDAALISLVLTPPGVRLAFDDLAVQQARRDLLAGPPPDLVTTLLRDDSHFEGALTARRGPDAERLLRDDPFARIFPARLLRLDAGLLGVVPAPAGPVIERYGSAQPWPADRFGG